MSGFPSDWVINDSVPREILEPAFHKNKEVVDSENLDESLLIP
jgi:hypothetical protein